MEESLNRFSKNRSDDWRKEGRSELRRVLTKSPLSLARTEYWAFLCAAALFAIVLARPKAPGWKVKIEGQPATGAFGATRSSDEPRNVQHLRGRDIGRGRHADAPWQIPLRGWREILWRTYEQVGKHRLLAVAAGVVFYGLLALFPAITALVSLYGLFSDASTINVQLSAAAGILPASAIAIVHEQIVRLTANSSSTLSFGFIFGLGLALWSANSGMKAIMDALNIVYEEKEKRSFIKLNLASFAFTIGAIASTLIALVAVVAAPLMLERLGLENIVAVAFRYARWPLLSTCIVVGLALIYRFGPSRRKPRWQWLSIGSLAAAAAWLGASALLSFYLGNYAHYDATYGSLGAGIGLMVWMWVSSIVILLGGQLNSEIEHQTAKESTVGHHKALGARGAAMADTVGNAA